MLQHGGPQVETAPQRQHVLRRPLAKVVLQIGLGLLSSTTADRKVRELAGHMQNSLARLQRLFEDVRNFAGPIRLERSNCLLSGVWRRAWSSLEPVWREREVELEEYIDGEVCCPVDALRVEQVFRNLFENALAACPDPVRVEVRCAGMERRAQNTEAQASWHLAILALRLTHRTPPIIVNTT